MHHHCLDNLPSVPNCALVTVTFLLMSFNNVAVYRK